MQNAAVQAARVESRASHPSMRPLFENQPEEVSHAEVPIEGDYPAWLSGELVRVGPGMFDLPGQRSKHWFEALGMLIRVELHSGRCFFTSRHLRSQMYARAQRAPLFPALAPWVLRAQAVLGRRPIRDNAAVNVAPFEHGMMAMTETPHRLRFDPGSLETLGPVVYEDEIMGHLTTAHPVYDPLRGCQFNYTTEFGRHSKYHIYALDYGSTARRLVTTLTVERPSYMHSFGATRDLLLMAEFPFLINPLKLRFGTRFLYNYIDWLPDAGTRVRAIHKDDGRVVGQWRLDPVFSFHHVAARQVDGRIEMDLVAFDDPHVVHDLSVERLRDDPAYGMGTLRRYTLEEGGHAEGRDLSDAGLELPRVNRVCATGPLSYVYGLSSSAADRFADRLLKIDADRGDTRAWREEGQFPGEPVFIPRPHATREDDGVVLSVIYDTSRGCSDLVMLDGESFEERCRLRLPSRVPLGFHGELFVGGLPNGARLDGRG